MVNDITVILNLYKRPEYLQEQVEAIKAQVIQPKEIWLCVNDTENGDLLPYNTSKMFDRFFTAEPNAKYHFRFAVAMLAQTEYVAFFDDDTIPGSNWFGNCLESMGKKEGIMGGAGCTLRSRHYADHMRAGWPSQNESITQVDLVGHAWFLRREWLNYMWMETPFTLENGEDIQLAYMAKKYGNINCYCPPHPENTPSMSSSLKAWEYGNDDKASSNGSLMSIPEFYRQRDECIANAINGGWETVLNVKL